MKKSALTIGLFSLVMVATSFTTPETVITNSTSGYVPPIDGAATGGTRKHDGFHGADQQLNNAQLNFNSVNQSINKDKKID